ncbi:MAG: hypothetical protein QS98_C0002G0019 [archaeon GW2011_AR3]|nr:MAG: hypothetical protein QS98_C0002G0019 [archaeon GW2011_AR3]MBS3109990.1 NAD-dependent epimerase/dehydratase family protein [Candidatus Woesearchaeota archaeon]
MAGKKKVLVTGGAGFIASHVVDLLVKKGFGVAVVDNLSAGQLKNVDKRAKFYKADITNLVQLEKVFRKERPNVVVHAAAQVQVIYSMMNPQEDAKTNIIGGINAIDLSRKYRVKKFVYLSTGGALYGEPEYLPADENHPVNPICGYGASKRALEYYLYLYHQNYKLDYTVLRFSNVYGPRDDPKCKRAVPNFILSIMKGSRPFITGDGRQGRDFIFVEDVARASLLAIERKAKDRIFNIGTQKEISINELFLTLKDIMGSKIMAKHIPGRKGEVRQIYLSNARAKKQLGWKPMVTFRQGLKKTVEYFYKEYK